MVVMMAMVILGVSKFIQVDGPSEAVLSVMAVIAVAIKLMSLSEHDVATQEEKNGCDGQHDVEVLIVLIATGEWICPLAVKPVDKGPTGDAN